MADYDVHLSFLSREAIAAVADAEAVALALENLPAASRSSIIDAIRAYEQGIGDVAWMA